MRWYSFLSAFWRPWPVDMESVYNWFICTVSSQSIPSDPGIEYDDWWQRAKYSISISLALTYDVKMSNRRYTLNVSNLFHSSEWMAAACYTRSIETNTIAHMYNRMYLDWSLIDRIKDMKPATSFHINLLFNRYFRECDHIDDHTVLTACMQLHVIIIDSYVVDLIWPLYLADDMLSQVGLILIYKIINLNLTILNKWQNDIILLPATINILCQWSALIVGAVIFAFAGLRTQRSMPDGRHHRASYDAVCVRQSHTPLQMKTTTTKFNLI